ncbi:MAG: hypothetical protein QXQ29_05230 [Candidatus Bathyarchaeia archaeon]
MESYDTGRESFSSLLAGFAGRHIFKRYVRISYERCGGGWNR